MGARRRVMQQRGRGAPVRALLASDRRYTQWLADWKDRIRRAQLKASVVVNRELVVLYWQLGRDILERQRREGWGARVIDRLAQDLRTAFPHMKGFSPRNLKYMRAFAQAWPRKAIVQQAAAQLPWFHLCTLLDRLPTQAARDWYLHRALEGGWSRNVLVLQIDAGAREAAGKAVTNFDARLPRPQSDLARESLKDPYRFDFLGLGEEAQERDIELALMNHLTKFLLELGAGFSFVGRQVHLEVGDEDFYLDLLFYHLKLRCYVVVELKAGAFRPEHAGKLNFYLSAVDAQLKSEHDAPSIGLLLCRSKNTVIAEYALRGASKPIGVAEFRLVQSLPARLEAELPSIEVLERALAVPPARSVALAKRSAPRQAPVTPVRGARRRGGSSRVRRPGRRAASRVTRGRG